MNLGMPSCNLGADFYEEMQAQDAGLTQSHRTRTRTGTHMPNINAMMPSKYLKKEDVPQPMLVTIRGFTQENVAAQGQPEEKKWIMHFEELENGLVMNPTNLQLAAMALKSEETEDWMGHQVVLYTDPNVTFGGRLVGGVRIREVRRRTPPVEQVTPRTPPARAMSQPVVSSKTGFDDMDDDIPF